MIIKNIKFNIQAKIITGYLTILICLGISLLIVNDRMTDLQKQADFLSSHDIQVHDLVNQLQKNVLDMETGMRGYVITGDNQYLDPYEEGSRSWLVNYNKLHSLLMYNKNQKHNLEEIKPLIQSWIKNSGEYVIEAKKANDTAALNQHFKENTGKKLTDQLNKQFDSFLEEEKQLTAKRIDKLNQNNMNLRITFYTIIILVSIITLVTAFSLGNSIVKTIRQVVRTIQSITESKVDLSTRIKVKTRDETRDLADAMNNLLSSLEKQSWIQKSMTEISTMYQGITDITVLAQTFITKLAPLLDAVYGVVYLRKADGQGVHFVKTAGYAIKDQDVASSFRLGEGMVGQCALDQRIFLIDTLPEDHIKLTSGLGASSPTHLLVAPIVVDGKVEAVVEFAALQPFQTQHLTLLDQLQDKFGSSITSVLGRMEVERLLSESQVMTEELQAQSEELQAQSEELQMQQEQLQISNDFLEEQNHHAEQRAAELKKAKDELVEYSLKLEESSQYKSDFLANMSHELRTPLNSILILSQMLMENNQEMDKAEVEEYSRVVYTAGEDLLRLIDDILDLSKIEAGKIEILTDEVNVTEIPQLLKNMFDPVAAKKRVAFEVITHPDVPPVISTDGQRLQQILKNLLSNAFKFTEQGSVTVRLELAPPDIAETLEVEGPVMAISVTDTGIGIPAEKQQIIFDAFQQVDGTTNRQYGGTGLGLSICREFTRLLGGLIKLESEPHKGSTFTIYIPSRLESEVQQEEQGLKEVAAGVNEVAATQVPFEIKSPSSEHLFKGKKVLLVDDDARNVFALVTALERKGMVVQVAENGKQALDILRDNTDFDLIFMDIMMPVMGGYEAMKAIRHDLKMVHLPIIALTAKAMKGERSKCMEAGASDYIMKPLNIDQLFSLMRVWLTEQVNQS
ncbi:CHASE3 domain-containing protein [Bacillus sp. UNC438CL73TsuS30]|uniref:CHASE3 domain-containing protein n=1 Tax=Bacillus sp. UNC438CL73TsuS30 TaxID=1340434 RepID=UPI000ABDD53C|nr:CHASE3 domain-containing protein [Bacillus sp. UNC438CL73TsuS30]